MLLERLNSYSDPPKGEVMNCPNCGYKFDTLVASERELPQLAPVLCEVCGEIGILEEGKTRKATPGEFEAIKRSPAYNDILKPVQDSIKGRTKH